MASAPAAAPNIVPYSWSSQAVHFVCLLQKLKCDKLMGQVSRLQADLDRLSLRNDLGLSKAELESIAKRMPPPTTKVSLLLAWKYPQAYKNACLENGERPTVHKDIVLTCTMIVHLLLYNSLLE